MIKEQAKKKQAKKKRVSRYNHPHRLCTVVSNTSKPVLKTPTSTLPSGEKKMFCPLRNVKRSIEVLSALGEKEEAQKG
jgi:hypothetical protein